ncbi:hypothetical protein SLA2020_430430 [Shorea laevis]
MHSKLGLKSLLGQRANIALYKNKCSVALARCVRAPHSTLASSTFPNRGRDDEESSKGLSALTTLNSNAGTENNRSIGRNSR